MLSSSGEVKIHNILTDYDVPFAEEYTFDDLITSSARHLRFDFAIFGEDGTLDALVEYQGKQHYQPVPKYGGAKGLRKQKYNDQRKKQYCLDHNIRLICIPYYDEPKISYDYIMSQIY